MTDNDKETKSPIEIAMDMQHKDLALKVVELQSEHDAIFKENEKLREKLVRAFDVINSDIGARKKVKIMAGSVFTEEDLDEKTIVQLDEILDHISKVKKPFTPIADQGTGDAEPTLDGLFAPWKKK